MITKIVFDAQSNFNLNGILKIDSCDFEKKELDSEKFFPVMVQLLLGIKKTFYKNLSDDQKILGDERINLIDSIDKFLTMLLSLALIVSEKQLLYYDSIDKAFEIEITLNKTNYITGRGKLIKVSSADITNYELWIEEKLIESFKKMIKLFNDVKNRHEMNKELIKLIYNVFSLRFKVEYV